MSLLLINEWTQHRIETVKKYIPGRGTVYVTERVPAPPLPSLKDRPCLRIYDPITLKEIPNLSRNIYSDDDSIRGLNIQVLKQRLQEIKEQAKTSATRISVFDPCTKRKVGSIEELETRIQEIECYVLKTEGSIEAKKEGTLQLQLHQEMIVKGVENSLLEETSKKTKDNRFLIGVLPRGGKTFIAGGLMRMMENFTYDNRSQMIILWITAAPNETKLQVEKELLGNFSDFSNYRFVAVRDARDFTISTNFTVFFVSSQLLTLAKLGVARERSFLSDILNPTATSPKLTMIFFDEAHKTGVGATTKTLVNELLEANKTRTMPFILLTGTYARILEEYQIPRDRTYIWDYTDVLSARNLGSAEKHDQALKTLQNRFGDYFVNQVISKRRCSGESETEMVKSYADYPDLHFITGEFNVHAIPRLKQAGFYTDDTGLAMGKLLQIKEGATLADFKTRENKIKKDAYTQFKNLDTLNSGFINLIWRVLERVSKISQSRGSRFNHRKNHSIIMFLPTGGKGTNIFYTLSAWASYLSRMLNLFYDYEFVCVVENENLPRGVKGSGNEANENISSEGIHIVSNNVKETILRLQAEAESRRKGLVILAGEKMSMGVSLPFVDVVMMLNDKSAPDDIIQKMYRAVTPSAGKTDAFIVDFSPRRTLAAIFGYTKLSSPESLTPFEVFQIVMNTYHWDIYLVQGPQSTLLFKGTYLSELVKLYSIVESDLRLGEGNPSALEKRRKEILDQELQFLLADFRGATYQRPQIDFSEENVEGFSFFNPKIRDLYADLQGKKQTLDEIQRKIRLNLSDAENNNYNSLRNAQNNVNQARFVLSNAISAVKKNKTRSRTRLTNAQRTAKVAEKQRLIEEKKAAKAAAKAEAEAAKAAAKATAKAETEAAKAAAKATAKAEAEAAKAAAKAQAEAAKAAAKAEIEAVKAAAKAAADVAKAALKKQIANAKAAAKATRNAARAAKTAARNTTRRKKKNSPGGTTTNNEINLLNAENVLGQNNNVF